MPSAFPAAGRRMVCLFAGLLLAVAHSTACFHHVAATHGVQPAPADEVTHDGGHRNEPAVARHSRMPAVEPGDPASVLGWLPGPAGWCRPMLVLAARVAATSPARPAQPPSVGVLLPLDGVRGAFGRRALAGIKLGAGLYDRHGAGSGGVQLVIRDTRGDPDEAVRQLEDLVRQENVIAVIGPMFADETRAVASRAGELEVALLLLSGLPRITAGNIWLFRNFLTLEAQAACLVSHATGLRGIDNFAVLSPASSYGTSFAGVFQDEVERQGGRMVATVEFDPATRDFRKTAAALRKKLPRELVVGLFVPADHRTLALIAPALAWADVIIESERPGQTARIRRSLDRSTLHRVLLLGGNGFHHPELLDWAGRYVEGAVFCDGFFAGSNRPAVQAFLDAYVANFGSEPDMVAAQARDTARALVQALDRADWPDRTGVRNALLESDEIKGATGTFSFTPDGEADKRLFLLTVRDQRIVEWTPRTSPDS